MTVIEQNNRVGGNAGSFDLAGIPVDYGSHRLHPTCDPAILNDISVLLKGDLLDRPRHGRIHLKNRWIHFPLKPFDLVLRLPPEFAFGTMSDFARKKFGNGKVGANPKQNIEANFASVMEHNLGRTICRDFYFPYARKIWGLEPEKLSPIQASKRVSSNSISKIARKVLSALPGAALLGLKPPGSGRFFYPRQGFGQISEAFYQAVQGNGTTDQSDAQFYLNSRVKSVELAEETHQVSFEQDGKEQKISGQFIWSTIPLTILAKCITPSPPDTLIQAASQINFRAMILVYLVLETDRFSEWDAHYFPDASILISRLSEPKNYATRTEPVGRTVLCAEIPCASTEAVWNMSDESLGEVVKQALDQAGLPVQAPVSQVYIHRIRFAYPIYQAGYETCFNQLDDYFSQQDRLLTFGRQGLFAHDNTHHALFMAYSAVDCLDAEGHFDRQKWQSYRKSFESHVVED